MNTLLSGFLGAALGSLVSSVISLRIFRRQARIQSNRFLIERLLPELQEIHCAQLAHLEIPGKSLNMIDAFQGVAYKEMHVLNSDLDKLKDSIIKYNAGREKSMASTSLAQEEIQAKKNIGAAIEAIMTGVQKLT